MGDSVKDLIGYGRNTNVIEIGGISIGRIGISKYKKTDLQVCPQIIFKLTDESETFSIRTAKTFEFPTIFVDTQVDLLTTVEFPFILTSSIYLIMKRYSCKLMIV